MLRSRANRHFPVNNSPRYAQCTRKSTLGDATLDVLRQSLRLARRITGNDTGSLGLHPGVYFYGSSGRHVAPLLKTGSRASRSDQYASCKWVRFLIAIVTRLVEYKSRSPEVVRSQNFFKEKNQCFTRLLAGTLRDVKRGSVKARKVPITTLRRVRQAIDSKTRLGFVYGQALGERTGLMFTSRGAGPIYIELLIQQAQRSTSCFQRLAISLVLGASSRRPLPHLGILAHASLMWMEILLTRPLSRSLNRSTCLVEDAAVALFLISITSSSRITAQLAQQVADGRVLRLRDESTLVWDSVPLMAHNARFKATKQCT